MRRTLVALLAVVLCAATVLAGPKFLAVWKAPDVARLNFAGKKVAALVMAEDQSLEMSAEESLVRQLNARGVNGIATYRIVPREELHSAEKAKPWFERAGVAGVVAFRLVNRDVEKSYTPAVWSSSYYQTFWGYYSYGWSGLYIPGSSHESTTIVVETLVFSLTDDKLLWAATSETKDPKTLQTFVADLVEASVNEMKKMKLVG
ncbi:MAG TPA: hypothetical protein VH583_07335 [Vicinamibacterales bacterium]|jgi:hypothetical protein